MTSRAQDAIFITTCFKATERFYNNSLLQEYFLPTKIIHEEVSYPVYVSNRSKSLPYSEFSAKIWI